MVIDKKLAAYDKGGIGTEDLHFGERDWKGAKKVSVDRGNGGIQISFGPLIQGEKMNVISKDSSGIWWISNDMTVPQGELQMKSQPFYARLRIGSKMARKRAALVLLLSIGVSLWAADRNVSIASETVGAGKSWQWTILLRALPTPSAT